MKRKIDIHTKIINNYKLMFNIDRSRMRYVQHYDQNNTTFASWNYTRTLLIMPTLNKGLFHIQMRTSFTFLLAQILRSFLLIMRKCSFYSPVCRGYICKISVHLVQKYFPHDCSTDIIYCSEQSKKEYNENNTKMRQQQYRDKKVLLLGTLYQGTLTHKRTRPNQDIDKTYTRSSKLATK